MIHTVMYCAQYLDSNKEIHTSKLFPFEKWISGVFLVKKYNYGFDNSRPYHFIFDLSNIFTDKKILKKISKKRDFLEAYSVCV